MKKSLVINPGTAAMDKSKIFHKPIHNAIITEDKNAIESLKKSGVKINDVDGQTPLHLAVILNKTLAVKKLSTGTNLNKINKEGFTPLHLTVLNDSVSLIKYLIDRDTESGIDTFDKNGFSALHIATVLGKVDAVRALLKEGANADLLNKEGVAPIHYAVIQGYSDVVDVLLEYVDKPNIRNKSGFRPLHLAVMYNQIDTIRKIGQLDKTKVNYLNGDGDGALHTAAKWGNSEAIEELHNLRANMNLKNSKGYCPIHLAVMYNRLNAIESLVQCGAYIDCDDRLGNTPLHLAVSQNNLNAMRCLCCLEANVNLKNAHGDSPLHIAIMAGNSQAQRLLLFFRANINVLNAKGMTPLHVAVCLGDIDVIENLFRYEIDIHCLDAAGNRPIHLAAQFCNSVGIKTLFTYGSRLDFTNKHSLTALDIIMQYVKVNTFEAVLKTLTDLYKKKKLKRKSPVDVDEILKCAKEIFRFEIMKNFEYTELRKPEYLSNIVPILRNYINDCFAEVQLMKSSLLHEKVPFFSIASCGWYSTMPIPYDSSSDIALDHVLDVSTTKGYPIYREHIFCNLQRVAVFKKALSLRLHTRHNGKTIFIDPDVVPLIIEQLSKIDLLNLLLAYCDPDPDVSICESSNVNKRKFVESKLSFSAATKKSNYICGTKKAQITVLQKSAEKSKSLSPNSSESVSSSKKASSSKTGRRKKV